jgi:hypothetical protein
MSPGRNGAPHASLPVGPKAGHGRSRRVRLALASVTPATRGAIDAAIRLAQGLATEVDCLFVEEVELFRAAQLPMTREVGRFGSGARRFEPADLAGALARQAALARDEVADAALRARVDWTFEVVRGELLSAALQHAQASDLLVIGAAGLVLDTMPAPRAERAVRAARPPADSPVVALAGAHAFGESLLERLLETAFGHRPLRLPAFGADDAARLAQALRQWRSTLLAIERDALAGIAPELSRSLRRVGGVVVAGPRDGGN